jgi:hypothetical protein
MADYAIHQSDISSADEVWLAVPGYEGAYEASNLGRIKSLDRWIGNRLVAGRILKLNTDGSGYYQFQLCKNNVRKMAKVHKIVAGLFCFNNGKPEVNHKNFNKLDNRADNLEWVTHQENINHYKSTGGFASAINPSRKKKLSTNDAIAIRVAKKNGKSLADISELFGVSKPHVWRICANQYHAFGVGV